LKAEIFPNELNDQRPAGEASNSKKTEKRVNFTQRNILPKGTFYPKDLNRRLFYASMRIMMKKLMMKKLIRTSLVLDR